MVMLSAPPVRVALLIAGGCARAQEPSWAAPAVVIAAVALAVSLVGLGFSIYSWFWTIHRRLVLDQTGDSRTDVISEYGSDGTTFQLNALVINASKTATIVIREFCLRLPWEDEFFQLLDDPRLPVPQRDRYKFPKTQIEFARREVINHKRNAGGVLRPGATIEGLLLGYSPSPVPQEYRHRRDVQVQFSVTDETGKAYRNDAFEMRISLARDRVT